MSTYQEAIGEEASVAQDLRARSPAPPRRVVAMTRDPALARALEELAGTGLDVCVIEDAESLSAELLQSNSSIAFIDSAAESVPVEGFVDALAVQFPELRLLVAGHSAEQNVLATRIASGRVFRFVHKPASAQRLKLMIDAASRPSEPQRVSVTQTVEALSEPRTPPLARVEQALGGPGASRLPLFGAAAAAVVALLAWLMWPDATPPAPQAPARAVATPASNPDSPAADLVRSADQAFAAGRYVAADGSSAAELYRDALKLDATDARAKSGFDRSVEFGLRGAEQALVAEKIDEAAGAAETLRLLVPGNSRLAFLQAQIDKERSRLNADASQRAAFESRQAQIRESISHMSDRLRRNALLEPTRDSAMAHFRAAEAVGPGDPAVRTARDTLLTAMLNAADARLQEREADEARRLIEAATSINSGSPGLDPLRRRLGELVASNNAPPAAPAVAAAPPAPAPVAATPAVAPPPVAAPAAAAPAPAAASPAASEGSVESALRRLTYVAPEYPVRALEQLVSGWVDLEFTVNAQGRVQDVEVIDSEPGNIFNSSAVAAARRWRYAPEVRDGSPVEQRVKQRVRFTARDQEASR